MLSLIAMLMAFLLVFVLISWIQTIRECHRIRFERDWLAEMNARLNWECEHLSRRLAEKTRAVGRLLQTLAGDGTRRN
jgi:hypothetical protein